ncbi:MAG: hypothetical protein ISP90_00370 [Nevskia sp.]|nr:hypothetical protein [Nevskia sp.]
MTEDDSKDSDAPKVVRLFPARPHAADAEPAERETGAELPNLADLGTEVNRYMAHARVAPAEQPAAPAEPEIKVVVQRRQAPPRGHRNAVRCSQCDQYTWRDTEECIHCGVNRAAHAAQVEAARHTEWQAILWSGAILSWGVLGLCLYALQTYAMPARLAQILWYAVYAIGGANAIGFWIRAMSKPRS